MTDRGCVLVHLTSHVYDSTAVRQAITDYCNRLRVVIVDECEDGISIQFAPPDGTEADASLIREFLNYVLDLSVRERIGGAARQ